MKWREEFLYPLSGLLRVVVRREKNGLGWLHCWRQLCENKKIVNEFDEINSR